MPDNENDKLQSVLRGALHDRRQPRIDVKTVFVMLVAGVTALAVVSVLVK